MPKLSELKIKNAKPEEKPYKLYDEGGLYLLVRKTATKPCSKLWKIKYRFDHKEKLFSIGYYPEVSLARAREKTGEVRELLAEGIDPMMRRKEEINAARRFKDVVAEWLSFKKMHWRESYQRTQEMRLNNYILPAQGGYWHRPSG